MTHVATAPAIIASKLYPPRVTSQHIPRRRLIDLLTKHRDRPLTLVCAPAGSGKSTLLSEWFGATSIPGAWVSLDERDNDPSVFLSYMLAAMEKVAPTLTFDTRAVLRAPVLAPLDALAASLSNDLDQISTDYLLVLDDYHVITNPQIDELLLQLLHHPPPRMHLAIATRAEPSWPLGAFRARGQMTELRFADLQFTAEESAALVRKALGDALDQDLVAIIHEESEGWAAGLQLMMLVAEHEGGRPRNWREVGASEDLGAYLFGDVLRRQPSHVQDHLLHVSILGRFSATLCEAVCDRHASADEPEAWGQGFLSHLERHNLFVTALGDRHEFFRLHHLFQRFLAARLRERFVPEQIAALHRRASGWFAAHGLIEEALDHALTAGDATAAAELVARHRHDLYNHEQFGRLTRWLRLLPLAAKEHHPELLLAEARIAAMNWRFTEATVFLDHAEVELARSPLQQERAEIAAGELAVLRGILEYWSGDTERLLSGMHLALNLLPLEFSNLRGFAHMGIAAGTWQRGDRAKAWAYLEDQLADAAPQLPVYATLLETQCFFHWLDGDLTNLMNSSRRLQAVSEELDLPDHLALAHYFIGITHFARNELGPAKQELAMAVAARFNLRLLWWCQAAGVLALTEQALGEEEQARQTLAQAHDFLLERHAIRVVPNLGAFQAELDRLQGRLGEASAWASQVEPGPLVWTLTVVDPRLAQARVFLSLEPETGADQATILLADLRAFCARVPNRRLLMEVEALEALLADRKGEHEAALEIVQRLVLEVEPDGYVRLFADLGDPMEHLLRQLAARRVAPHAVARILGAFPTRRGLSALAQQSGLVEPLSERELEILALLGERDSNKEIATRLFIAPSTVKRHTLNIYRKLDVSDRREAVARATELGLLPPG